MSRGSTETSSTRRKDDDTNASSRIASKSTDVSATRVTDRLRPLQETSVNVNSADNHTHRQDSRQQSKLHDDAMSGARRAAATRGQKRRLVSDDEEDVPMQKSGTRRSSLREGPSSSRRVIQAKMESNNDEEEDDTEHTRHHLPRDETFADEEEEGDADLRVPSQSVDVKPLLPSTVTASNRSRDKDGYAAGEIVRVKLSNFVTYDFVEFSPGPHLNMIIGPNGTGKSTIVCAIALGLGYKPSVLGRAKDVSSFVKHGCESATIEIELKGKFPRQSNQIISRIINVEDNASEWRICGARATAKGVSDIVEELGIEIGNLCCFLPQEKVSEFANLGPSELLRETQMAAGNPGMTRWHDKLISLGKEERELKDKIGTRDEEVRNLEEQLEVMSRDVQRAEERRQIEVKLCALDALEASREFSAIKAKYEAAKERKAAQKKRLQQLKGKLSPISNRLNELQDSASQMEAEIKTTRREVHKNAENYRKTSELVDKSEQEVEKLTDRLHSLKKVEQARKATISQLRKDVQALEDAVREEPPVPNTKALDTRTSGLRGQERALVDEDARAKTEQEEITTEIRELSRRTDNARRRLQEIDNVKNVRLQMLQRVDIDTYNAVMWLRENANLFQQKVFEPIMLEASVRDARMASAVEGCINFAAQKTFVCQTAEDYDTFGSIVADKMRLRVNFVHRQHARALHQYQPPASREEIDRFGFDGYILDLLEGPEPILRYLCSDFHLESIPYAANERRVDAGAVERAGRFQRYVTGRSLHTLTRSQYGSRATQTLTRTLRNARTFVHSVDQSVREGLDADIHRINERKKELEARGSALSAAEASRRKRAADIRAQRQDIEQQKGEMLKVRGIWEKDNVKLGSKKLALKQQMDMPSALQQSRKLGTDIKRINDKAQKAILEACELLRNQIQLCAEENVLHLQLVERRTKAEALTRIKEREEGQFEEAQQEVQEAGREVQRYKDEGVIAIKKATDKIQELSEEERRQFDVLHAAEISLEQVQTMIVDETAKLNMSMSVQPGVLERYHQMRKQLETQGDDLKALQRSKHKIDDQISSTYRRWKPALDELIASVSARFAQAFEAVGNAGSVHISEHEDYEKWGIDIMVRFRNEEDMQLLTGQRQSGGERSITTITYLLSLTQMSRCPFSLVDEINQGMDQKYERQVHDHMVRVTCAESAGQYFLITPKLLPDLTYHERMRVLIINNGEWLPEKFDFWHYIRRRKDKNAKAGRTTGAVNAQTQRAVAV